MMFRKAFCLPAGFLLLLAALLPATLRAQQTAAQPESRYSILIVSSYNPDTRRMSSFISDFERRIVASGIPYDIYIENLECRGVADASVWMGQMQNVIARYEEKGNLRAIILLGQEAWASFVTLDHFPSDVQLFGCFASTNGVLLPEAAVDEAAWQPESVDFMARVDTLGNFGGLLNKYDIRRNVDLIRSLYPEVENIAFVSDNTYGGISLQSLVEKEFRNYPDLNLVLVDSRAGDSAAVATYAALPARSAAMIGTWRVSRDGQYLMQRSLNELMKSNSKIPVFSITGSGIGDIAVGGYIPKYDNGAGTIADQIVEGFNSGRFDHTHFHISRGEYRFDSRKLKELKIAEYALPAGSVIEDTMAAKLSKYSHYIDLLVLGVVILVLLLVFVAALFVRTRRLQMTLEKREGELAVALEKAEESDMLKSAFLANMSHEIRTPLNAIVGFSSLMQTEELPQEERAEYCAIVVNNSEMLLTLLNDILDISSLECGRIRFNYSSEDIVQICQHAILTTAHTRQEGVECRLEAPCDSYMLVTDAHRLSQILINLLSNAAKFTPAGSITVAFEIHPESNEVLFSVTDTGTGIPLEMQEMVFNRFEKLKGNKKKGTGLGLAICRQIAVIFGGNIWVDPAYTGGARFVFSHPIVMERHTDDDGENPEGGGILSGQERPAPSKSTTKDA